MAILAKRTESKPTSSIHQEQQQQQQQRYKNYEWKNITFYRIKIHKKDMFEHNRIDIFLKKLDQGKKMRRGCGARETNETEPSNNCTEQHSKQQKTTDPYSGLNYYICI